MKSLLNAVGLAALALFALPAQAEVVGDVSTAFKATLNKASKFTVLH